MKACDVMVSPVVTVKPSATVKDIAKLFLERQISAVPVVGGQRKLVGMMVRPMEPGFYAMCLGIRRVTDAALSGGFDARLAR